MATRRTEVPGLAQAGGRGTPLGTSLITLWMLCAVVFALPELTQVETSFTSGALQQVAFLAPFYAFTIGAVLVARSTRSEERTLWGFLAAAAILVTAGETVVSVRFVFNASDAWTTVATITSAVASLVLIVGLAALTDIRTFSGIARVRHLVDVFGGAVIVVGVVFAAVTRSLAYSSGWGAETGLPMDVVAAAYSAVGAVILSLVVVNFMERRLDEWPRWERRVVFGLGVYGLATMLWPVWFYGSRVAPSTLWDLVVELMWMSGMSLAFSATVWRLRAADQAQTFVALPRLRAERVAAISSVVPIAYLLGIIGFGVLVASPASDAFDRTVFSVLIAALAAVSIVRTIVTVAENEALLRDALVDPVTGIHAHRYFHERLQLELDLARRHGDGLGVMLVDVDDFRRMNDAHGHSYGDSMLRAVAGSIVSAVRSEDAVCRVGGDQFGVIIHGADMARAFGTATRVREAVSALTWPDETPLTASVGIALFPDHAPDRIGLVRAAERACLWAKCRGKDRTVLYEAGTSDAVSTEDRLSALQSWSHVGTIRTLACAVDAREPHARYHSQNVAVLVRLLGEEMGFDEEHLSLLEAAALMHDVGKLGVPESVLTKRGALSAEESRLIREHPALSERIAGFAGMAVILPWIRHHHERWDGSGYPDGHAGEAIPLESRIIALCDAFDVMTSGKPQREPLTVTAALQEVDLCIGTQFDPVVAEAFIRVVSARRPILSRGAQTPLSPDAP